MTFRMSQVKTFCWKPEGPNEKFQYESYLAIKYAVILKQLGNTFFLFHNDQIQKFGSTRNKIGFQYSLFLNELYVREVFVSKFHTSVVRLKIQSKLRIDDNKHCTLLAL